MLVREKASYYAPPYRQGRAAFGEYCRKVGFGVDGGGGWLWEMLGPVTDRQIGNPGHSGTVLRVSITIRHLKLYLMIKIFLWMEWLL